MDWRRGTSRGGPGPGDRASRRTKPAGSASAAGRSLGDTPRTGCRPAAAHLHGSRETRPTTPASLPTLKSGLCAASGRQDSKKSTFPGTRAESGPDGCHGAPGVATVPLQNRAAQPGQAATPEHPPPRRHTPPGMVHASTGDPLRRRRSTPPQAVIAAPGQCAAFGRSSPPGGSNRLVLVDFCLTSYDPVAVGASSVSWPHHPSVGELPSRTASPRPAPCVFRHCC